MRLGSLTPDDFKLGSLQVDKIYLGTNEVWSKSQPWSPSELQSLVGWFDASDTGTITTTGDDVDQWDDKSGSGWHLENTTAAEKPHSGTRTINGLNAIDFDGVDDILYTTLSNKNVKTLFMVFSNDDAMGPGPVSQYLIGNYLTDDNSSVSLANTTGSVTNEVLTIFEIEDGVSTGLQAVSDTNIPSFGASSVNVISMTRGLGDWFISANGEDNQRDLTSGSTRLDFRFALGFGLGASVRIDPPVRWFDGMIAEVIMLDVELASEARQRVEGYLAHKWGTTASLPSGHPYKSTAPQSQSAASTYSPSGAVHFDTNTSWLLRDYSSGYLTHKSTTTGVLSFWVKLENTSDKYLVGWNASASFSEFRIRYTGTKFRFQMQTDSAGALYGIDSNNTFTSTTQWYHVVGVYDSTEASESDRMRLYVNGIRQDATTVNNGYPPLNQTNFGWDRATFIGIGCRPLSATTCTYHGNFRLSEVAFCDGAAYGPEYFATGVGAIRSPRDLSVLDFGNEGWWLRFDETGVNTDETLNTGIGKDSSGALSEQYFTTMDNLDSGDIETDGLPSSLDYSGAGASFSKIEIGSEYNTINCFAKLYGDVVLAGAGKGGADGDIFESTDNGATWTKIADIDASVESVFSLTHCSGNIVLAGVGKDTGDGDVWRSTDGGHNWTKVELDPNLEICYAVEYCGGNICLAGVGNGGGEGDIWRSTDRGLTWTKVEMGASVERIMSIEHCYGDIVLAGAGADDGDGHIWRSTDLGLSWNEISMPTSYDRINKIKYIGSDIVLAGAGVGGSTDQNELLRSTDLGQTWVAIELDNNISEVTGLEYVGGGVCLAGSSGAAGRGDVWRSTNEGLTWSIVEMGSGIESIFEIIHVGDGVCLAGSGASDGDGDVWRSTL